MATADMPIFEECAMPDELGRLSWSVPQPSPTVCPACKGTGLCDSGGTQPWGELILVPCDCEAAPDRHDHCAECGDLMPNQISAWCDACRYDGPRDEDGEPTEEPAHDR